MSEDLDEWASRCQIYATSLGNFKAQFLYLKMRKFGDDG